MPSIQQLSLFDGSAPKKRRRSRNAPPEIVDGVEGKSCTKCGEWKPLSEFHQRAGSTTGTVSQCIACKRPVIASIMAKRRADNPELSKRDHAERYAKRGLEDSRKYRAEKRDSINARKREWRKATGNHDTIMGINRRRGAEGSFTSHEWKALCARYGHRCLICQGKVKLTRDHIVPVKEGGTNYIWSLQPLCGRCNSSKNAKHLNCRPDRMIAAYRP